MTIRSTVSVPFGGVANANDETNNKPNATDNFNAFISNAPWWLKTKKFSYF